MVSYSPNQIVVSVDARGDMSNIKEVTFEVRNYRCFSNSMPLKITLFPGITAIVGANGAGKSSALKFFSEFREMWAQFAIDQPMRQQSFRNLLIGNEKNRLNLLNVRDSAEIFHFESRGHIKIKIDFVYESTPISAAFKTLQIKILNGPGGSNLVEYEVEDLVLSNGTSLRNLRSARNTNLEAVITSFGFQETQKIFFTLSQTFYVSTFRNAINSGGTNYYDIQVGTAFIQQWDQWRNGDSVQNRRLIGELVRDVQDAFGLKKLDISASSNNQTLLVENEKGSFRLEDVGAGLAHFILVLGNLVISRRELLLIDEPELSLHPALQVSFITCLAKYCSYGVIYSTHSIGLARSTADQILSIVATDNGSRINPFDSDHGLLEFAGEMSYSLISEIGFKKILLCEGKTETRALPHFLRLLRKEHDVLLLSMGGSEGITPDAERNLLELKRLNAPIFALIDSEKTKEDEELSETRKKFVDVCNRAGVKIHVLERRAFENYLVDEAIKTVIGENGRALQPFESLKDSKSRNHNMGWNKEKNWKISSRMTLKDLEGTDLSRFLSAI
jgi:AAA15 family ATPase/GTPase